MIEYQGYQPTSLAQLSSMTSAGLPTGGLNYGNALTEIAPGQAPATFGTRTTAGLTPEASITQALSRVSGDGGYAGEDNTLGKSFESLLGLEPGWNTPQALADVTNFGKDRLTGLVDSKLSSAISSLIGAPIGLIGSAYRGIDYLGSKLGLFDLPNLPSLKDAFPNIPGNINAMNAISSRGKLGLTQDTMSLADLLGTSRAVSSMFNTTPTLDVNYGMFGGSSTVGFGAGSAGGNSTGNTGGGDGNDNDSGAGGGTGSAGDGSGGTGANGGEDGGASDGNDW